MRGISFPHIADQVINRAVRALGDGLNTVIANALMVYLVDAYLLSASSVSVEHKLGRTPRGFILVGSSADTRVWSTAAATETTLTLRANVDGDVTLLVF